MLDRIARHIDHSSERPALFVDGRLYTYGELASRVAAIQKLIIFVFKSEKIIFSISVRRKSIWESNTICS